MDSKQINHYAVELYQALRSASPVAPLTEREPDMTVEDAYHISRGFLEKRLLDGERIIGKKIGVTSKAVQNMLGVHQPDFGYLTDAMLATSDAPIVLDNQMIAARAEGEIAFVLKRRLMGPGVTNAQVLAATECVMPCFEIVDSRIQDWNIKIQDTVADNASCGMFVLGDSAVSPRGLDLTTVGMVMSLNGKVISTGAGAAALGSPVNCVAWLANTLGQYGIALEAGEVILSGSLVPLQPVKAGDSLNVSIGGLGTASVRFA